MFTKRELEVTTVGKAKLFPGLKDIVPVSSKLDRLHNLTFNCGSQVSAAIQASTVTTHWVSTLLV